MRSGFTLIEVLVALVIFHFGMLALAAITIGTARDLATANRRARAQAVARNRVQQLRASACPPPSAGFATLAGGLLEFWRIEADASRRTITDSVDFPLPRARRDHIVFHAWIICR